MMTEPEESGSGNVAPVRVLIADELPLMRYLLARQLAREAGVCVVAQAADGSETREAAERHHPDVIVLNQDILARDKTFTTIGSGIHVVVLTDHAAAESLTGAWCALSKRCTPAEISAAVRSAARAGR